MKHEVDKHRIQLWLLSVGLPLVIATSYALVLWRKVLIARGFGYIFNAQMYGPPFKRAQICVMCLGTLGLITYPFVRPALSRPLRWSFIVTVGLAIGILVVPDIISNFGPQPWWGTQ